MSHLRIQFTLVGATRGRLGGQVDDDAGTVVGGATLEVGAAATPPAAQPVVPDAPAVLVRLCALGAAVHVAVGAAPDPAREPRYLVLPGESLRLRAPAGARLAAILADEIPAGVPAPIALVSGAAPLVAAGSPRALSLNPRGALRVVAQHPDGTDVDTTAPLATLTARSMAATVVQAAVTNAAPAAPALAANPQRRAVRLHAPAGGPAVFWGPTAAVTAATGFRVPAGAVVDLLPGYAGDVFLVADAAGPVPVSIAQLV